LAKKDNPEILSQESALEVEDIKRHLDMLEQRLDNIDSIVSAVAERVMNQPIVINITCPHCGSEVEISVIGSKKPRK
jgi:hypothetical protein